MSLWIAPEQLRDMGEWGHNKSGPRRCVNTVIQGPCRLRRSRLMCMIVRPGLAVKMAFTQGGDA